MKIFENKNPDGKTAKQKTRFAPGSLKDDV